jgi:hypothetical protein
MQVRLPPWRRLALVQGEPTDFTVSSVLTTCAGLLGLCMQLLSVSAFDADIFVASALVDMYGILASVAASKTLMSRYFSRCHSGILPHGMRGYIGGYAHIADAWNDLQCLMK